MKNKVGYIGIKEASKLVGVHPDTIRRLIKQHKGSKHIVQGKGTKAPYFISSDWLKDLYGLNEPLQDPTTGDNPKDDKEPSPDTNKAISGVYEAHIEDLKHQIAEQNKTIAELLTQHKDLISQQQQLQDQLKFILLPANSSKPAYEADLNETKPDKKTKKATEQTKEKEPKNNRWWKF